MRKIYLQTLTTEQLGIVEEGNKLTEVIFDRPEQQTETGNIYLGKVTNVEKSLQAVFISYGGEKMGFLNKKELPQAQNKPDKPIESLVTEGQSLIVQVIKEAYQQKGAVLTANITLPGNHVVYLPYGGYLAVSKKLNNNTSQDLKNRFSDFLQEKEGGIIRTSAATISDVKLEQEFKQLRQEWKELKNKSINASPPALLWEDELLPGRLIKKYVSHGIDQIICDDPSVARLIRSKFSDLKDKVFWHDDWEEKLPFGITQLIDQLVNPYVTVPGGAELVIEQTEAMAVIDVNSRHQGKKMTKNETALQVNTAVVPELVRQVRLRNLSGMILVDFITMKTESDRKKILRLLRQEVKKDMARIEIHGFTALGLLELTRKREAPPISLLLTEEKKRSKLRISALSKAYQLERDLIFRSRHNSEAIVIEINPAVYQALQSFLNSSRLLELKTQNVYSRVTEEIEGYEFRMEGTTSLVENYIQSKYSSNVDKLF